MKREKVVNRCPVMGLACSNLLANTTLESAESCGCSQHCGIVATATADHAGVPHHSETGLHNKRH